MFDLTDKTVREKLFDGMFGLEKENLRVLADGSLSHTPHPVPGDKHIVRDFSENQIEINTSPHDELEDAMDELAEHEKRLQRALAALPEHEYLWPFSNPPYISGDEDIPEAVFEGEEASKTVYRKHLAEVYGRRKMTFSGIHVNYSFSDELIAAEAGARGSDDISSFKDRLYVDLAAKMMAYGWILVPLTAASPVTDISFEKQGKRDETVFEGMSSLRCSEYGYWNFFIPVLDYTDISTYTDSINGYVESGKLMASTELYYPVRLKPPGVYDVNKLKSEGADHIELRMFDLNPLVKEGLDSRDVVFAKLMMIYLASGEKLVLDENDQMHAVENFKEAARCDLSSVKIVMPGCRVTSPEEESKALIEGMRSYFDDVDRDGAIAKLLDHELAKFTDRKKAYSSRVLSEYGDDYVKKGILLARERQEEII